MANKRRMKVTLHQSPWKDGMKYLSLIAVVVFSGTVAAGQSNLPLDRAAREGNLVEVKRLLEQGSDPNELNKWGTTALTGASTLGSDSESHTEIVRILLMHGADVNKRVADGSTAINEASFWGHESTVRALLDAKSHVDSPKDNGYTALLSAASRGHLSIVKLLIASGAAVNHQTPSGLTALHLASGGGYNEVVKVLLDSGARPDIKNIRGETYQDVAGRSTALQAAMNKAAGAVRRGQPDSTLVAQLSNNKDFVVHRDNQAGFIFQYPKSWSLVPSTHQRTRIKIVSERGSGGEDCGVNVQVNDNLRNVSLEDAMRQMPDAGSYQRALRAAFPDATVVENGKTHLSNQDAVFYVATFTVRSVGLAVPMKGINIQTVRNGRLYTAACRAGLNDFDRLMPVFQIIFAGFLITN